MSDELHYHSLSDEDVERIAQRVVAVLTKEMFSMENWVADNLSPNDIINMGDLQAASSVEVSADDPFQFPFPMPSSSIDDH